MYIIILKYRVDIFTYYQIQNFVKRMETHFVKNLKITIMQTVFKTFFLVGILKPRV